MIGGLEQVDLTFGMNREALRGDFNRYRYKAGHMGTKWSDPLEFTVSLMKDVCSESSQKNLVFTEEEVNLINAWLTSPDYPTLFHMYDYDFERDSLNNMILIDAPEDSISYTLTADGYAPVTYELEGDHCRMIFPGESDLPKPPKPRVQWLNGFYSIQYYMDDYPSKITSITCDGVEYRKIETNEWLSMYDAAKEPTYINDSGDMMFYPVGSIFGGTMFEDTYTVLLNKVKTLNVKYDYYGLFTEVTPQTIGGEVIGFTATFTTNSPFAWTGEIVQYSDVDSDANLEFNVATAERYREVYPVVQIHVPAGGSGGEEDRELITLESVNDSVVIKLLLMKGATTTIDCEKCMITYVLDGDSHNKIINDSVNDVFYEVSKANYAYLRNDTIYLSSSKDGVSGDPIEFDDITDIDWATAVIDQAYVQDGVLILTVYKSESDDDDQGEDPTYFDTRLIYWPKLRFGKNSFRVGGDCTFAIRYREPRKVGDW